MKRPIDYINDAGLQDKCGALLTPAALDAINRMMVLFAREYAIQFRGAELTLEDFEQDEFNQMLLPKEESNV